MEHIIKQLKNGAKHTHLSLAEKAEIKTALLRHVKSNPSIFAQSAPSPFSVNNFRNKKGISILVIIGLLLGGSVSFAAEKTVPGDVFYPVKIHINEQVRGVVAVTPKAKADWDVRKAERRLEEVEKLALTPDVSQEVKIAAEENFNASTNKVEERIANFEKENDGEDAERTAEKLADMLRKRETAFDKKSSKKRVSVSDASFADLATTTVEKSISPDIEVNSASIDNVRENIRGARGKAEQKQKELKNKYRKDSERKHDSLEKDVVIEDNSSREKTSSGNHNKSFYKRSRERKEEIHRTLDKSDRTPNSPQSDDAPKADEND
ncbi:MAG: DUF5667 domain-containing protein [Patescibacteria group bacterium]